LKQSALCFCLIVFLLLGGCTGGGSQIHERMVVQGIGVDYADGVYSVTLQVFSALNTGAGEEGDTNHTLIMTAEGESVMDSFSRLTLQTGKEPLYSQNLVLIFGKEAAKAGMQNMIDFFIRYYEARPEVKLFVADGKAEDLLTAEKDGELITAQELEDIADGGRLNARVQNADVLHAVSALYSETSDPSTAVLALKNQAEETRISSVGTAVFQDDKLVDILDLEESRGLLLLRGEAANGTEVLDIPGAGKVTYSLAGGRSRIDVLVENNHPIFQIKVEVEANLYEIDGDLRKKLPHNYFEILEQALEQEFQSICEATVHRTAGELHCDLLDLGKRLRKSCPQEYKLMRSDWRRYLAEAQFEIEVDAKIKRIGQEVNPI
jgi:spore germination protein KC